MESFSQVPAVLSLGLFNFKGATQFRVSEQDELKRVTSFSVSVQEGGASEIQGK